MKKRDITQSLADGRASMEFCGPVGIFTVTRPHVRNALDLDCIEALSKFVSELERRPDVSVAIITGQDPGGFIAGGDLAQFALLKGHEAGRALSGRMGRVLARLELAPQVVIAAINGDAYGGGFEVALACDLRFMDAEARLVMAQRRFGLTTGWGGGSRLVRAVGYDRALMIMLQGAPISAQEAMDMRLITRIAEPGAALAQARDFAERIGKMERPLVSGIKRVALYGATLQGEDAISEERRIFAGLWASKEHEARVESFLKRKEASKKEA